jgi:hypothetical protein
MVLMAEKEKKQALVEKLRNTVMSGDWKWM